MALVHRESVVVKMKEWRSGGQLHIMASGTVMQSSQAVRPGIQQGDSRGASFSFGSFQIFDPAQQFLSAVLERCA
jgi:hypothetical protein